MKLVKWLPLFFLGAALESTMQISFKKGATIHMERKGLGYYFGLLKEKWVIIGLLSYGIEMVIWILLLSAIPLSIAFPLTGIQQVFLILFSAFILKEKIDRVEWLGVGLVAAGIGIIVGYG
ncbi:MAG: EamA family transporter [Thermodesulfobacteriota bacterium]|jgi:drug/metabolite transporter (DMT)-like permease